MRVAMVLRRLDLNDGVASHLETLVTGLSRAGHRITLLTGPVAEMEGWNRREQALSSHTVDWHRVASQTSAEFLRHIGPWLRQHPADVLHVHGMKLVPIVRRAVCWRKPVVATAHPSHTSTPDPSAAKLRLLRLARPFLLPLLPDRAVAVSTEMADWFVRVLQVPRRRVRKICHGIDTGHFSVVRPKERSNARRQFGLSETAFVCVTVGRFDPGKRHETAVRALARLAQAGRPVQLLVAGSGAVDAHARALSEAAGPRSALTIRCVADVPDIRTVYAAGDAIVHPSEREAFALVVAEAMLCGLVPLRTPTGGAADQIEHGRTGFLFPVGDADRLAELLVELIDQPQRATDIGSAAADFARRQFSAEQMVRRTVSVYDELAS